MSESPGVLKGFRLSVKSLDLKLDPGQVNDDVQVLRDRISLLSDLEKTQFTFFPVYTVNARLQSTISAERIEPVMFAGLRFEAPLDKFKVVLRCVGDWLDRTGHRNLFALEIPPTYTITLQTSQAKELAQLLPLGEALLPPQEIYFAKAQSYIGTFGDFTPVARANLAIVRQRVGLEIDEANEINAQTMGPFKSLTEKYQHFRKELLVCKQESALAGDLWKVMEDKAATMRLPRADAQFLKAERLNALRAEADQSRQQVEAKAEAERQQYLERQQRLRNYRQSFEQLVAEAIGPGLLDSDCLDQEREVFEQSLRASLSASPFRQGRLSQEREFYNLNQPEIDILEKQVLDELYLYLA